jgi:hypothetical protein
MRGFWISGDRAARRGPKGDPAAARTILRQGHAPEARLCDNRISVESSG